MSAKPVDPLAERRRAALGGLCPTLRPLAVAHVGRDGIDYLGGAS